MQKLKENPELNQLEASLRAAGEAADKGEPGAVESTPSIAPKQEVAAPATETSKESEPGLEKTSEAKAPEATQDEKKQPESDRVEASAEKTESKPEEKADPKESKFAKAKKDGERLDKSWKALNEEKERFRLEKEAHAKVTADAAATAKPSQAPTPAPIDPAISKWTPEQLDDAADGFEQEGKWETAKQARMEAQRVRTEIHTRTFWKNADEFVAKNPELKDDISPLGTEVKRLLATFPAFHTMADGFARAVEVAKAFIGAAKGTEESTKLTAEASSLKTQIAELTKEIERLKKATALTGSPPSERSAPKALKDMTMEEQEAALRAFAREEDATRVVA